MVARMLRHAVLFAGMLALPFDAWAQTPAPDAPPSLRPVVPAEEDVVAEGPEKDVAAGKSSTLLEDEDAWSGETLDGCCEAGCDAGCLSAGCDYDLWTSPDVYRRGQFFVQGWLAQGFTWNTDDPQSRFNSYLTFNDRANEYQMNQLYLSMGRRVNTQTCNWDWGGRADFLYGTDYFFTMATGLETRRDGSPRWNSENGPRNGGHAALYGLAMPQLYAEVYAPWGYGTTFKFGHFYTILGYESVMAPENFFYSHSYVKQYGEPFTHTGMLGSYNWTPQMTLHAGFTRGWNTWEDENNELGFLGGASWTSCDGRAGVSFALHSGKEDLPGENNRTSYTLLYRRKLSDRLTYVFQHDYGIENDAALKRSGQGFVYTDARWYGINQYLLYAMTCNTSLGFRFEWFRDEENARLLGGALHPFLQGGNACAATVGLNWRPTTRVTVRPELRWDWSDVEGVGVASGTRGLYDDFQKKNRFTAAVDAIFVF
ncbi:MAG: porin [Pirellulales bacterium]|nr:porin [Pirellulales bacterium]